MYSSSWSHLYMREASPVYHFQRNAERPCGSRGFPGWLQRCLHVQKNAWMDKPTFLYWTESICNQFSLSNQPTCLFMDSCAVHETAAIKEPLGNHGTKVLDIPRALQAAFKLSTLASTNRSSTTCNNILRLLCYQMVKKMNDCTSFDGWLDPGRELRRKP